MTYFGFELTDTNVTTSNGAMVVSSIITVSNEKPMYICSMMMLIKINYRCMYNLSIVDRIYIGCIERFYFYCLPITSTEKVYFMNSGIPL